MFLQWWVLVWGFVWFGFGVFFLPTSVSEQALILQNSVPWYWIQEEFRMINVFTVHIQPMEMLTCEIDGEI